MSLFWTIIFWASFAGLLYTFPGYPFIVSAWARLRGRPAKKSAPETWPDVTAVIIAHNEQERIPVKIENLLESDYPPEHLNILVVSDGSTDGTAEAVRRLNDPRVNVLALDERGGKARGLNAAMERVETEITVYADARQRFEKGTVRELVENFSDPDVGAASGALFVEASADGLGKGMDVYWRLEKVIRESEGRLDSCIGCTGAVYAIRTALYKPMPEDTLIDDVVTPMQIVMQGYRVTFDREARAWDPQTLAPEKEAIRKTRTLAGNFQILSRYPQWLLPWANRTWLHLLSHKYMRLAAPLLLVTQFTANAMLAGRPFYMALFCGQLLFYALAAFGLARGGGNGPLYIPGGFVFLNINVVRGFLMYVRGDYKGAWKMAAHTREST